MLETREKNHRQNLSRKVVSSIPQCIKYTSAWVTVDLWGTLTLHVVTPLVMLSRELLCRYTIICYSYNNMHGVYLQNISIYYYFFYYSASISHLVIAIGANVIIWAIPVSNVLIIMVVIVWWLDLQLPMQSVPITTNVVSLNPAQARCTRFNIMW